VQVTLDPASLVIRCFGDPCSRPLHLVELTVELDVRAADFYGEQSGLQ
jgi:hypothetical protein